jgi:hypothetical protein
MYLDAWCYSLPMRTFTLSLNCVAYSTFLGQQGNSPRPVRFERQHLVMMSNERCPVPNRDARDSERAE